MATLSGAALQATAGNIPLPNAFRIVRFSDGTRRTVLESEIPLLDDCIKTGEPVRVDSSNQVFYVQTPSGGGNATLDDALALRAAGMALAIAGPDPNAPQPGTPPLGNVGEPLKFTFFIYDHLGNSRILYANQFEDCAPAGVRYLLEHVLDYYPYGKTLREYVHNRERFQTTGHERDAESGLDHRGARNYDGDVGRFLGVDPLAGKYAGWSTYNYVLGNPVILVDPTGRNPEGWSKDNIDLANRFGLFGGSETFNDFFEINDKKSQEEQDVRSQVDKRVNVKESKNVMIDILKVALSDEVLEKYKKGEADLYKDIIVPNNFVYATSNEWDIMTMGYGVDLYDKTFKYEGHFIRVYIAGPEMYKDKGYKIGKMGISSELYNYFEIPTFQGEGGFYISGTSGRMPLVVISAYTPDGLKFIHNLYSKYKNKKGDNRP